MSWSEPLATSRCPWSWRRTGRASLCSFSSRTPSLGAPPVSWRAVRPGSRSPSRAPRGSFRGVRSPSPETPFGESSAAATRHLRGAAGEFSSGVAPRARAGCAASLLRDHPELELTHQCGQLDEAEMRVARDAIDADLRRRWQLQAFYTDPADRIAWADLVVMRAGGSSLAEVSALGLPMVVVPYPHARDHQRHNAALYVEAGAA